MQFITSALVSSCLWLSFLLALFSCYTVMKWKVLPWIIDDECFLCIIILGIVIQVVVSIPCQLDYNQLCNILTTTICDAANPFTIINLGNRGGLGHKFVSMMYSLSYAILLKRNFLSSLLIVGMICSIYASSLLEEYKHLLRSTSSIWE